MSIRKRTALLILTTLCGLVGLLYGIARTVLEDGFLLLEQREAHINVERVRNALDEQLNFIASKAQDWAVWDDTYKFVQDHNAAYIESNISENTLSNLKIHMLVIVNNKNEIVQAIQNMNPEVPAMQPITPNVERLIKAGTLFVTHGANTDTHKGLVILPEGPLLVVSKPIVPTNVEGEIKGTLIFAKFVDAATVARLSEVTKLPIEVKTREQASEFPSFDQAFKLLTSASPSRLEAASPELLHGFTLFHDVEQKPALVLRIDMPREVLKQGRHTIETMILAIISAGLIFGLIIFGLLEKTVVARILNLSRTVTRISASSRSKDRVQDQGRDEIRFLADSINGMLNTIDERNQQIRNIFDNVSFGLFICDKNMIVAPGVTQSCHELLDQADIENKNLATLLGLDPVPAEWMLTIYQQIFDDFMPTEVTLAQVPNKFLVKGRYLKLEGKPLKNAQGEIDSVLFSISDVSKLEEVERDNREHRTLVKILKAPQAFTDFLKDARCQFTDIREALGKKNLNAVKRPLHTLKGNYSVFDLMDIVHTIHAIEEKETFADAEIDQIEEETQKFLDKNRDILQIRYDEPAEPSFTLAESQLVHLEQALSPFTAKDPGLSSVLEEVSRLRRKPVRELLGPINELVKGLADRLSKSVRLETKGFDLRLEPSLIKPVVDILPHLIRNSLDHGLEVAWDRKGKPEQGRLSISFEDQGTHVLVKVSDDGRGLNLDALTRKALSLGVIKADEVKSLSAAAKADLIFRDQLSTAESVSDISGRGVGMGAVKETIEKAGGEMKIINIEGKGLTVEMLLKRQIASSSMPARKIA